MTITTKYDIGQEVWAIICETRKGWQWNTMIYQHPIIGATVIAHSQGYGVAYQISDLPGDFPEADCFLTQAEAQQERDRRNGK